MSDTNETGHAIIYACDLVAFCGHQVLLITRGWPPFQTCLALPGGHVDRGETSRVAAAREASEETGLVIDPVRLHQVGVYDNPHRDPRGRVVSVAYTITVPLGTTVTAGDDAATATWIDIDQALRCELAFDHGQVLADAYDVFRAGALVP